VVGLVLKDDCGLWRYLISGAVISIKQELSLSPEHPSCLIEEQIISCFAETDGFRADYIRSQQRTVGVCTSSRKSQRFQTLFLGGTLLSNGLTPANTMGLLDVIRQVIQGRHASQGKESGEPSQNHSTAIVKYARNDGGRELWKPL